MTTLTKADMVAHLMHRLPLTKQDARLIVDGFFEEIAVPVSYTHLTLPTSDLV